MKKILAYGFPLDANFGGPSVVHGLCAALKRVCPEHELIVYQQRKVDPISVSDLDCPVRFFPYWKHVYKFYRDGILLKLFGRRSRNAAFAQFWDDFSAADVVVNIYAICFCSTLRSHMTTTSRLQTWRMFFQLFGIGVMARLWGKPSVKSTSSFGPLEKATDMLLARRTCRWAFTRIVSREEEGRRQLIEVAHVRRPVAVAPDLANAWCPEVSRVPRSRLGVAVSFQSEIQWAKKGLDYIGFMRKLVEHAAERYGCEIILLPNQLNRRGGRDDVIIAEEILASVGKSSRIRVFDTAGSSPLALREAIASCSVVVSCRYHTCVAAFASAVPTLVLGWHCKYQELVKHYGQERWMLSTEDCEDANICSILDDLWVRQEAIAHELKAHQPSVIAAVDQSVAYLMPILVGGVS